ncbi:MAG: response regulator, partial [Candidatus Omnitrophica bacterium]|nr:response regulator [Candidatus Omnitrophota bacterium]
METKKKILIVDDEKEVCASLSEYLARRDFDVTVALSGKEAIKILSSTSFPVIILDIKMPDADGIDILKATIKEHPDTKILMLTGFDEENQREQCLAL